MLCIVCYTSISVDCFFDSLCLPHATLIHTRAVGTSMHEWPSAIPLYVYDGKQTFHTEIRRLLQGPRWTNTKRGSDAHTYMNAHDFASRRSVQNKAILESETLLSLCLRELYRICACEFEAPLRLPIPSVCTEWTCCQWTYTWRIASYMTSRRSMFEKFARKLIRRVRWRLRFCTSLILCRYESGVYCLSWSRTLDYIHTLICLY